MPVKTTVSSPRIAIVHDWMIMGGAEKVVEQLLKLYPDAPLYTSCITPEWRERLKGHTIITSYLDSRFLRKARKFQPLLRQRWFESLDLSGYDLVISTSGAEAKGIKVPQGVLHLGYCHAPTHYYWSRYETYLRHPGFGIFDPLARTALKILVRPMRSWDYQAAQRAHVMVGNSSHIVREIKKYYHRDAKVIFPPVDVRRFTPPKHPNRHGFLVAGRQTAYKRFDLAIQAANQLRVPLTVIGNGPDHARLLRLAGPTITFKTNVTDDDLVAAFQQAQAFLFPGVDDFGITPVEAMAAGCPVIAFKAGGALDYVLEGKTGLFFEEPTVESLAEAMQKLPSITFQTEMLVANAKQFSPEVFTSSIQKIVHEMLTNKEKYHVE